MNNTYRRYDNSSEFAQFLINVASDSEIPFITATRFFPNHIPTFNNFIVTQESKDALRNYKETDVTDEVITFNQIDLPFIPDEGDIFAIWDTYTIQDTDSPRSIINFNYFYNPTITNFMKLCRIKQYILNNKIVFADDFVFVDTYVADMLRRIRYVSDVDTKVHTYLEIFSVDSPIIDSVTPDNITAILSTYGTELYDQECDDTKIEVVVDDVTGDVDNESKLGNLMDWKNSTSSSFRSSGSSRMSSKPVGRMTIYNGDILEENSDENNTDSELSDVSEGDEYTYEYTYENTEKPFEDAQRLQALWSIARDRNMLRTLMKTPEFKQWKNDHDTNMSNKEFMVALLRGQVPLNTEDVTGLVFFDTLDVMNLYNLYDELGDNTESVIDDFNAKYGSPIVWDDQMPYEVAYPDVFDWIKDVLDLD